MAPAEACEAFVPTRRLPRKQITHGMTYSSNRSPTTELVYYDFQLVICESIVLFRTSKIISSRRSNSRHGIAAVELAVCLPVLVLLMLGAIESSNIIFLRQAMVQSSYEAVKLAARPDATAAEAISRAESVLTARQIDGHAVTLNPTNTQSLARGADIVATVTAPLDANRLVPFTPFSGQTISVSLTAVKH